MSRTVRQHLRRALRAAARDALAAYWSVLKLLPRGERRTILLPAASRVHLAALRHALALLGRDERLDLFVVVPPMLSYGDADFAIDSLPYVAGNSYRARIRATSWSRAALRRVDLVVLPSFYPYLMGHGGPRRVAVGHGIWAWTNAETSDARAANDEIRATLLVRGRPTVDRIFVDGETCADYLHTRIDPALPVQVTGNPAADELCTEQTRLRNKAREAFGVRPDERLLVIMSTHGPQSLFGRERERLAEAIAALAGRYKVLLTLHPANFHDRKYGSAREHAQQLLAKGMSGAIIAPPNSIHDHLLPAADIALADHTSMGSTFALLGKPMVLYRVPGAVDDPRAPFTRLAGHAPTIESLAELPAALSTVESGYDIAKHAQVAALISRRGDALAVWRDELYQLLELAPPAA